MSNGQQQQQPTSAEAPSFVPTSSATIDVTDEFSNEQIDAFLSANPEFAARALDEASQQAGGGSGGLSGAIGPSSGQQDFAPGFDVRSKEGFEASQRMASGADGGTWAGDIQQGGQYSMTDPNTFSPPNSLSPEKQLLPSPPEGSMCEGDERSLSPFSSMMAQAGVPPVPTMPSSSFGAQDVLTPPPSSVSSRGSGGSAGSADSGGLPTKKTIVERRLARAQAEKQKTAHSAPSEKTMPQVGRPVTGLYSSSGFDVLGALSRVVSRPNPRVNLGPVDFSCSFLVVDIRKEDCPIVYSSPTFSVLTGYENKEILGKNCRFLQGPDAQVAQGSRRKYTDNVAVSHLKRNLSQGRECQASLINYRKDGSPFINLVTVVPIPWDTEEIAFHVGFQVDLVESPNAILKNITDGTYQVNYQVLANPQNPLAPAAIEAGRGGRSVGAEMKEIVRSSGRKEARDVVANLERAQEDDEDDGEVKDLEKELMTEWYKTMADHSDDFIHVLSLKGQFQYVSPSVRRVLDYEPEDLQNKFISDICHPSDVVPIMRELKDSTQAPPPGQAAKTVNFLCRVERKTGGTVWLECTGRLYIEPGKGRKAVILSGRERVMPKLEWSAIGAMGGIGGGTMEGWGMLSFEGLVLNANAELKDIFGVAAADGLVGESLLDFIPPSEGSRSTSSTVAPSSLNTPFQEPIHQRIADALKLAARGQPSHSGVTIRHQIVVPCGALSSGSSGGARGSVSSGGGGRLPIVQEVATTIYAIQRDSRAYVDLNVGLSPGGARDASQSPPFGSDNTDSFPIEAGAGPSQNKLRQTALVFQVKLLSQRPQLAGQPPRPTMNTSFQTAHESTADVFEALDTSRTTGWQYELHQLRIANKRLKETIAAVRSGKTADADETTKARRASNAQVKRKRDIGSVSGSSAAQSPSASMPPPPLVPQHHFQQQQQYAAPTSVSPQQPSYSQSWSDSYPHPDYSQQPGYGQQQYSIQPPTAQYYHHPPAPAHLAAYLPQMSYQPPPSAGQKQFGMPQGSYHDAPY